MQMAERAFAGRASFAKIQKISRLIVFVREHSRLVAKVRSLAKFQARKSFECEMAG